ncbi:hypothetical protein HXX76_010591 [Chlamydomonas incerta]|uniref:Uncharacterized protein n=1 Tax=Chlamydomonas incerta TaxID=51695 RepID=A0A835VUH6_CHLIN|nr:hypothetical protein HXX76_010591 [Chlamydomonas incerta]|eukprot:KAG2429807.1 hypothetical protein HXX76_010591 [Chlamydomonas incerta]
MADILFTDSAADSAPLTISSGAKEVYSCGPRLGPSQWGRYTVDFADLATFITVAGTGKLTWSGELLLTGTRPSPRRSWLWLLVGAMAPDANGDGAILFQGVQFRAPVPSPLHNPDDPFWLADCQPSCPELRAGFSPSQGALLAVSKYDTFLYEYEFALQPWIYVSQRRQLVTR